MQDYLCGVQPQNACFSVSHMIADHLIRKLPAYPGHAGIDRFVALPETTEGKGGGSHLILCQILAPFQRYRLPKLMRNAQAIQGQRVQSDLVCCPGHRSGGGHGKGMPGIDVAAPADLHLPAAQLFVLCETKNKTFSGFRHVRVVGDQRKLLQGDVLEGCLAVITGLPEGHFHHVSAHAVEYISGLCRCPGA